MKNGKHKHSKIGVQGGQNIGWKNTSKYILISLEMYKFSQRHKFMVLDPKE